MLESLCQWHVYHLVWGPGSTSQRRPSDQLSSSLSCFRSSRRFPSRCVLAPLGPGTGRRSWVCSDACRRGLDLFLASWKSPTRPVLLLVVPDAGVMLFVAPSSSSPPPGPGPGPGAWGLDLVEPSPGGGLKFRSGPEGHASYSDHRNAISESVPHCLCLQARLKT